MQYNDFISAIEHYYGNYDTPEKKKIMTEYIMDNVSESELEPLFKKIILSISSQYKTPPDVAMLSGLFSDKLEIRANNLYDEISKKASAYNDLIISDICAFMDEARQHLFAGAAFRLQQNVGAAARRLPRLLQRRQQHARAANH